MIRAAFAFGVIFLLLGLPFGLLVVLKERVTVLDGVLGYFAAAGIGVFTNATILIPTHGMLPLIAQIAQQNGLVSTACVYAFASAVGESTSYLVGRLGNAFPVIRTSQTHAFLERYMQGRRKTGVILFLLAVIPVAPFDVGGIIAGNAKSPYGVFFFATFTGRWLKYLYLIPAWEGIEKILAQVPWFQAAAPWIMIGTLFVVVLVLERRLLQTSLHQLRTIGGE